MNAIPVFSLAAPTVSWNRIDVQIAPADSGQQQEFSPAHPLFFFVHNGHLLIPPL